MVTVFLTDEAQDALIENFKENGFSELCDEEWTADILLELTDICMTLRCQKVGEEENYQKLERFFPPTVNMRDTEKVIVNDQDLEALHDKVEDFLAGEVEVPGIPTDEDSNWVRNTVLFRRLVIPYIKKYIEDGSIGENQETSGIHIFCEDDEIRSEILSGEDRPELVYAKFAESGDLIEEPGKYYADEIFTGEKLISCIQELDNRPEHLNIDGIGEELEWPPQFLDEYQCARMLFDGRRRKNELGAKVVPVNFRRKDFMWQRPKRSGVERLYVTVDTLSALPEVDIPIKRIPEELLPETIVEIIDSALTCVIETDGPNLKNTKLSLYNRFGLPMLSPVRAEAAGVCEGVKTFLEDGHFAADGEGYLGDVAFSLLFGYKKLLGVLIASDWFGKHGKTENSQSGILIDTDGDAAVVRRVTGKQRPELICSGMEGERACGRVYQTDDECNDPELAETVRFRELLDMNRDPSEILAERIEMSDADGSLQSEVEKGNPYALKLMANRLMQSQPTIEIRKQALDMYEKAAELLPDDSDIEFEIFMLKMELENP